MPEAQFLSAVKESGSVLEFQGSNFLRTRLALSILSGKSIRISRIRDRDDNPGLKEFEASLIRLVEKITNGSKIEVNETGTKLTFAPGLLSGGKVEHNCSHERGIGYFLELLLRLGPYCKHPLNVSLKGVTNTDDDPSPELLKSSGLNIIKSFFRVEENIEIRTLRRGCAPGGGGLVNFKCRVSTNIFRPLQVVDQGKIKRIRGTAWATRVSPSVANRMVEAAKGILLKFIPDVYLYTDHQTGAKSGNSPGFGLTLTAETTTGTFLSAEVCSKPSKGGKEPTVPEELAEDGAKRLLEEIYRGGCIDSTNQSLMLLHLALTRNDVSKVVLGPLSTHTVHFLRHLKDFFGSTFKLESHKPDDDEELRLGADKVLLTCVGANYKNISHRTI